MTLKSDIPNDFLGAPGFVRLTPPLEANSPTLGAVQIHGIAEHGLLFSAPHPATQGSVIHLRLGENAGALSLQLAIQRAGLTENQGEPHDEPSRAALAALLARVRKGQHIALCAATDVEGSRRFTGFDAVDFIPKTLPNLAWQDLVTTTAFLGRNFRWPFLITGMTGGIEQGAEINRRLAAAAAAFDIPMGVGSQRIALEHPEHRAIFAVKDQVPNVFLIANIGAGQLGRTLKKADCLRAVSMIDADALAIHVNVLQELVQVEGDRDFRGLLEQIAEIARDFPVPVLVKEVGSGVDVGSARLLAACGGLAALDIGGAGGTSWGYIEGLRAASPVTQALGETFRDWGLPTAESLAAVHAELPLLPLIATGGIRSGLVTAKALALGATMVGVGLPLFRAALVSAEEPLRVLETMTTGLKIAMLATGSRQASDLRQRLRVSPEFENRIRGIIRVDPHLR